MKKLTISSDETFYTLRELCDICGVHAEIILELTEYGILEPHGKKISSWRFTHSHIIRSKKALRLQKDLNINLPGVALVLELLDEATLLRRRVNQLERKLNLFEKD